MLEIITFSTTLRANNLQMGEKFKPSIEELMNLNMQNATLNVMDENEKIPRRCKWFVTKYEEHSYEIVEQFGNLQKEYS